MEILRCENLIKTYGEGNTQVKALDNVSFSVEQGEFVSIIGPSGSGKSTLLHILGGVDKPTSARIGWIYRKWNISGKDSSAYCKARFTRWLFC